MKRVKLAFLVGLLLLLLPLLARADCDCSSDEAGRDKAKALRLKIAAIVSILICSTIGVCIPILGKWIPAMKPEKDFFFVVKAFAAGVILATGFIHILPDGFEDLTSPCLDEHPWQDFPFAGFCAMVAAMATLMIDTLATSYFSRSSLNQVKADGAGRSGLAGDEEAHDGDARIHLHTHATHGHAHGTAAALAPLAEASFSQLIRNRVIAQVFEFGVIVHSVIIGISLGASQQPKVIRPLVAALSFHQFFEGMGLGGCIAQAKFEYKAIITMGMFFSLTTPVGIAVGIAISSSYNENSPTALIVEGVLNSSAAGILIYMALVDLLAEDFMNPKLQSKWKLQVFVNVSLLLGAGLMSLIAKWA